jgi:class 3 adenylate cyclase
MDAAGSERAAIFTYGLGGPVGALLAADHPDRVGALVMYASVARTTWAPDYDWANTVEERAAWTENAVATWGEAGGGGLPVLAPSMADDPAMSAWFARLQRLAASPSDARMLLTAAGELDVREALGRIDVPALVMRRAGDEAWDMRHSRYLADHIPGARYVEVDGVDSLPFVGDSEALVEEIEEFLTGARADAQRVRALLTVMFTDIVDATATAAQLGDDRWRDLLARHDEDLRKELVRFGGREVKTVGDGFLAIFDGLPSRALRCAQAITSATSQLGMAVRVGIHTGECELIGEDVGGMAVHIASRVNALAGPGEILVSGTVYGTVVGGSFAFEQRGFHELKGVPDSWPLFALAR